MRSITLTDVGKVRSENQDAVFSCDSQIGILSNLYILADGMGGHRAGEVASNYAINTFVDNVKNTGIKKILSVLEESVKAANAALIEKADESKAYEGMGTTLVAATISDDIVYIANVGDSRLYLVNDEIRQITRDHSLVQEMINIGELDKKSARTHKNKNVITKAIGTDNNLVADFFDIEFKDDDILLMCSDGLTNMVEDKEIKKIIMDGNDLEAIAKTLIETANKNGGKDNISVILIKKNISE